MKKIAHGYAMWILFSLDAYGTAHQLDWGMKSVYAQI